MSSGEGWNTDFREREKMPDQMEFLFIEEQEKQQKAKRQREAEEEHRHMWEICWGWDGPQIGQPCEIDSCVVPKENGESLYCYMERCIVLEQLKDGRYLAEIAMGIVHGQPWSKDGTRVVLGVRDIWPPTRDIRGQRERSKLKTEMAA